ncbi:MAG TPA: hypothetical protein PLP17_04970 [Oligoflexia bacterium]|nr:hypothetical protein [Oligoflexia bacterium]
MPDHTTNLNIYGLGVAVRTAIPEIHTWLQFDFNCYLGSSNQTFLQIEVFGEQAPPSFIPELVESMHSPEYVAFDDYPKRYVDYYGRAMVLFDYAAETAVMYSADLPFLYEKLYLLILSRSGEKLDRQGLHRVHGMAVSFRGTGCLFLMPSHGGKSTLALSLLRDKEIKLIAEDTPLIDHHGIIYPFLLKLGLSEQQIPGDASPNLVRVFDRNKWGKKSLLHLDYFAGQIQTASCPMRLLFIGKWIHGKNPQISRISRCSAFATLLRDCVFGLGLPQIVEYFLTSNKKDLLRKSLIALSRFYACTILARRCIPYCFLLSSDSEANRTVCMKFLNREINHGQAEQSSASRGEFNYRDARH